MEFGPYVRHAWGDEVRDRLSGRNGWLVAAITHSIPWTETDVMVEYDGSAFFLRGIRQDGGQTAANLAIECARDAVNEKLAILYKFCSVLGWYKGGYVDIEIHHWATLPIPIQPFGRARSGPSQGGRLGFDCNYLPVIADDSTRLALAFWREALSLRHVHEGYSFLSFFKVIESQHRDSRARTSWIDGQLPALTGAAEERIRELTRQGLNASRHLFDSGRCAVAHATMGGEIVDPDLPDDRIRLHKDIVIIRDLAQRCISEVLQVPTESETYGLRDRLAPIHSYIDSRILPRLTAGESISRRATGLHGLLVDVRAWARVPDPQLHGLRLNVNRAYDGVVEAYAENPARTLAVAFAFDFNAGRAHTDLEASNYTRIDRGGDSDSAIAIVNYRKEVLQNGLIEVVFQGGEVVQCEVVIPVNIDIGGSVRRMDALIARLRQGQD